MILISNLYSRQKKRTHKKPSSGSHCLAEIMTSLESNPLTQGKRPLDLGLKLEKSCGASNFMSIMRVSYRNIWGSVETLHPIITAPN